MTTESRSRPSITMTVAKTTAEGLAALAPPRKTGQLLDVILSRWVREVARKLATESTGELQAAMEADDFPDMSNTEATLAIKVAAFVVEFRVQAIARAADGLDLARFAQDIDTRFDGCPPWFEAIRAEVYQAEAARLDAERSNEDPDPPREQSPLDGETFAAFKARIAQPAARLANRQLTDAATWNEASGTWFPSRLDAERDAKKEGDRG